MALKEIRTRTLQASLWPRNRPKAGRAWPPRRRKWWVPIKWQRRFPQEHRISLFPAAPSALKYWQAVQEEQEFPSWDYPSRIRRRSATKGKWQSFIMRRGGKKVICSGFARLRTRKKPWHFLPKKPKIIGLYAQSLRYWILRWRWPAFRRFSSLSKVRKRGRLKRSIQYLRQKKQLVGLRVLIHLGRKVERRFNKRLSHIFWRRRWARGRVKNPARYNTVSRSNSGVVRFQPRSGGGVRIVSTARHVNQFGYCLSRRRVLVTRQGRGAAFLRRVAACSPQPLMLIKKKPVFWFFIWQRRFRLFATLRTHSLRLTKNRLWRKVLWQHAYRKIVSQRAKQGQFGFYASAQQKKIKPTFQAMRFNNFDIGSSSAGVLNRAIVAPQAYLRKIWKLSLRIKLERFFFNQIKRPVYIWLHTLWGAYLKKQRRWRRFECKAIIWLIHPRRRGKIKLRENLARVFLRTLGFFALVSGGLWCLLQVFARLIKKLRSHWLTFQFLKQYLKIVRRKFLTIRGCRILITGKFAGAMRVQKHIFSVGRRMRLFALRRRTTFAHLDCFTKWGVFGVKIWVQFRWHKHRKNSRQRLGVFRGLRRYRRAKRKRLNRAVNRGLLV